MSRRFSNTEADGLNQRKNCNCKKSSCLKLYCECFAAGSYCGSVCKCLNCCNNVENETLRMEACNHILEKNPNAFRPKVDGADAHEKGCHCKRSYCLKKYCECFQHNIYCTDKCRCLDCRNYPTSVDRDQIMAPPSGRATSSRAPPAPSLRSGVVQAVVSSEAALRRTSPGGRVTRGVSARHAQAITAARAGGAPLEARPLAGPFAGASGGAVQALVQGPRGVLGLGQGSLALLLRQVSAGSGGSVLNTLSSLQNGRHPQSSSVGSGFGRNGGYGAFDRGGSSQGKLLPPRPRPPHILAGLLTETTADRLCFGLLETGQREGRRFDDERARADAERGGDLGVARRSDDREVGGHERARKRARPLPSEPMEAAGGGSQVGPKGSARVSPPSMEALMCHETLDSLVSIEAPGAGPGPGIAATAPLSKAEAEADPSKIAGALAARADCGGAVSQVSDADAQQDARHTEHARQVEELRSRRQELAVLEHLSVALRKVTTLAAEKRGGMPPYR